MDQQHCCWQRRLCRGYKIPDEQHGVGADLWEQENRFSFEKRKVPYSDLFGAEKGEIEPINAFIWK